MWNKVTELLGLGTDKKDSKANELQIATAALMVSVASSDGEFCDDERERLTDCLTEHFWLTSEEAEEIIDRAHEEEQDAPSLYRFTRAIAKELDQEGRQEIVRLLWQVAFADNRIDNFEANVLAKIAGLLGVTEEDRIRIKHEVEAATA
ncbi:TerB family tellurite resistance protein [Kordiimonas gwangyangensis]|uniref:tellurite resistance TerB family protein n=1 Tax=Kordiimonas gwangyangensis TaxID=288022 RepID=UPI00037F7075|nr:TerB family tellurite resistance protein [Kordiimonas gwangyangensis]